MAINHDLMAAGGRLVETKDAQKTKVTYLDGTKGKKEKRKKKKERMEVLIHWTGGIRHSASLG